MPDKGHSNGSKFCDQEKVVQTYSFHKFWTRKLKNQIYNCSCLQGVQRPRKRDFEKCMGRVRKTPLSRVSVKTLNNQIKVTAGITNMNYPFDLWVKVQLVFVCLWPNWEWKKLVRLWLWNQQRYMCPSISWKIYDYNSKMWIKFVKWCHGQYSF